MYKPKNKLSIWLDKRLPIPRFIHDNILTFKVPKDLNYFYTFGGILCLMLLSQCLTGVVMAIHYIPYIGEAFSSIEIFSRSGAFGWLFRPWHAIGASFFFIAIYIHMARSLYYKNYQNGKGLNWVLGMFAYLIMLAIAFFGYILVWGQISWSAATIVSNFFTAIPFVGEGLKSWFLGGYEVGQASLTRFYVFHYLLSFFLILIIILHIWAVHTTGQTRPKENISLEKVPPAEMVNFFPKFWLKDLFAIVIFILFFCWFLFFIPDYMVIKENYIEYNEATIIAEIIPEWHILPFYAMLKSINFNFLFISSSKLSVWVLFSSIFVLFWVPLLDKHRGGNTKSLLLGQKIAFWALIITFVGLGYLGSKNLTGVGVFITQILTAYYFSYFLILLPLFSKLRKKNIGK